MKYTKKSQFKENCVALVFHFCGLVSLFVTVGIVMVLFFETLNFFREVNFFDFILGREWTPLFAIKHFGVLPLISGTLLVFLIAMIVSVPLGLLIAILIS